MGNRTGMDAVRERAAAAGLLGWNEVAPVDMRKSIDGLSIAVTSDLELDPTSGHLFCVFNRRANQVRVLFWEHTGCCIYAKRLARGRFSRTTAPGAGPARTS